MDDVATVAREALEPIWRRAESAARRTSADRRRILRAFALDLRVLVELPANGPRLLGFIDRPCVTRVDWECAARGVAARYGMNLELRDQLTLRLGERKATA